MKTTNDGRTALSKDCLDEAVSQVEIIAMVHTKSALCRDDVWPQMAVPVLLAAPGMIFLEAKSSRLKICKLFSFTSWSDELRILESTVIRRESESKFRSNNAS